MTNTMRMMLAGVALSALAAQGAWAQPVAGFGFGSMKLPGAGTMVVAVGEPAPDGSDGDGSDGATGAEDPGADQGTTDEGTTDEGATDDGATDEGTTDDDGMAWAGGSPDFCESCGGEVIDGGEIAVDPAIEGEPGTEVTEDDGAVYDDGVVEDEVTLGDGREFCENCRDLTPPEVMYSTTGGITGTPRAEPSATTDKSFGTHQDRSNDRTCRQRPMTGDCLH